MNVQQILDLVAADTDAAEDHITKAFDWQFERAMNAVRLGYGAAGSLLVALIALLFKSGAPLRWWEAVLIAASAVALGGFSSYRYYKVGAIQREFIAALQVANEVKPLAGFLRTYRASRTTQ